MSTLIEKGAFEEISRIKSLIKADFNDFSPVIKKQYNFEFTVKEGGDSCKILVYFGKKGVKTILQGNESAFLFKKIDALVFDKGGLFEAEVELNEPEEYIGTDESGKGDIFGPLVIAAVYTSKSLSAEMTRLGVKDSKLIKNGKIEQLADSIINIIGNRYTILELPPAEYNSLYDRFKNLNKLLDYAHSLVIEELLGKVQCRNVITDQFAKKPLSLSSNILFSHVDFTQLPKGEKFTGVAAASILARDRFEKWFVRQEELGFRIPKGASADVEAYAKKVKRENGIETLLKLTKNHFKPVKSLIIT